MDLDWNIGVELSGATIETIDIEREKFQIKMKEMKKEEEKSH